MIVRSLALTALALLAASCAPMERPTDANPAAGAPAVNLVGEAQRCVMRDRVRQTLVRTNRVIDFEMQSGTVYRSILPNSCPGLSSNRGITYETSINQLCRGQIIYSLDNFLGEPPQRLGAGCGLGEFVPVEYVNE
jgi:hypothetical protein